MRKNVKHIVLWVLIIFSSACSTEKNAPINRWYHNTTSHYNVYFNGRESYKEGILKAEENIEDDFSMVLPVFLHSSKSATQQATGDMDRAIKKATKTATLHSITTKPEVKGEPSEKDEDFYKKNEYIKWIDDAYLLMGKSYLFKTELGNAMEAFRFIITKYHYDPIVYDAQVWLAMSLNEKGDYVPSEKLLNSLEVDEDFPEKLKMGLNLAYADLYIKKEEYENAIPKLEIALENTRKKYYKIRYTFILAQLYQLTGNPSKAFDLYGRVIKMNPPYIMTFNAKINRAGAFDSGNSDSREIKAQLYKMLKDEKNEDFLDQIYFALGNIARMEGDIDEAIENYKLSIANSTVNTNQKALSYLTLADIYYAVPDYLTAQLYYDSTLAFIDYEHPDYRLINSKATTLTRLVNYLNNVEKQDSLLKLSKMGEKDRFAVIDKIIEDLKQAELEAKQREQDLRAEQQYNRTMLNENRTSNTFSSNSNAGGKWYFYNPQAKAFGQSEFKMKWGERKLEDNWRRKNKSSLSMSDEFADVEEEDNAEDIKKDMDNKTREYYLVDIPLTDSARNKSHIKIQKSLYNAGLIYRNDLKEKEMAVGSFEDIIKRYDYCDYTLPTYFNLYQIYKNDNNTSMANKYKSIIINEYPESNYAKLLKDPNYLQEILAKEKEVPNFYMKTLEKYNSGQYSQVINDVGFALKKYPKDPLIPKFLYLKAISKSQLKKDDVQLKEDLTNIIFTYPKDEVSLLARNTISMLEKVSKEVMEEVLKEEEEEAKALYAFNLDTVHYFAFLMRKDDDIDQMVFNIVNFNLDNYPDADLTQMGEDLNDDYQIVLVKKFKTGKEARNYMKKIVRNKDVYRDVNKDEIKSFIITPHNYEKLKTDDPARYELFYESAY